MAERDSGHIRAAVNLPFSGFTDEALRQAVGDDPLRPIYIYCNNNFSDNAYPVVTNTHRAGILRVTVAPTRAARLQRTAEAHLRRVMDDFGYAGVLTLEFFVERGRLVANEMAPRVHNSGHWTIEGAATSQF